MEHKAKPRIACLREKVGLTQLELSQLVGVTETTIQNWESGRAGTDQILRIIRFCKALNCQIEDLIEIEYASPEAAAVEPAANPGSLAYMRERLGTDQPSPTTSLNEGVAKKRNNKRSKNRTE